MDRGDGKPGAGCTATLLPTGRHVLTAAHCVAEGPDWPGGFRGSVRFDTRTGAVEIDVTAVTRHPVRMVDLAVLTLRRTAPKQVQRYDIYRREDELDKVFTKVSYNEVAVGRENRDEEPPARDEAEALIRKAQGLNRFDAHGAEVRARSGPAAAFWRISGYPADFDFSSLLFFDFDDGTAVHDFAGTHLGRPDRGLGRREVNTMGGDSGSPAFIGNRIAGVTVSGGSDLSLFPQGPTTDTSVKRFASLADAYENGGWLAQEIIDNAAELGLEPLTVDVLNALASEDCTVGEFSTEQRVSAASGWVDAVLAGRGTTANAPTRPGDSVLPKLTKADGMATARSVS